MFRKTQVIVQQEKQDERLAAGLSNNFSIADFVNYFCLIKHDFKKVQ